MPPRHIEFDRRHQWLAVAAGTLIAITAVPLQDKVGNALGHREADVALPSLQKSAPPCRWQNRGDKQHRPDKLSHECWSIRAVNCSPTNRQASPRRRNHSRCVRFHWLSHRQFRHRQANRVPTESSRLPGPKRHPAEEGSFVKQQYADDGDDHRRAGDCCKAFRWWFPSHLGTPNGFCRPRTPPNRVACQDTPPPSNSTVPRLSPS